MTAAVERALRAGVRGEIRFDAGTRALYATDASNHRLVPLGVVFPRDREDLVATIAACRDVDAPVLVRGAGTSLAGQACNRAVVVDTSRHLTRIVEVDPDARLARVEPGTVLDRLREAAAPHGLTFAPDPATHSRCTVGGMLGNNSCGVRSVRWGTTADSVAALDVLTYRGDELRAAPTSQPELDALCRGGGPVAQRHRALRDLVERHATALRTGYPSLRRRVSGYALDRLLPEHGHDLAAALVGTEGTCVTVLEATVRLVPLPPHRALVVAGFADVVEAAAATPSILEHAPLGLEGFDGLLVECLTANGRRAVPLPEGGSWLMVEVGGATAAEARDAAEAVRRTLRGHDSRVVEDRAEQRAVWQVREDGAGHASRLPGGGETWEGWEDAAVPPERLAAYLGEFRELMRRHHRRGVMYGHFGEGCVHVRLDFDLAHDAGIAGYRRFMEEAADLVVAHGGSLSGEHGDGQSRSELLPRMYPPELIRAFAEFKALWDPDDRMNPGIIVRPRPLDGDLRLRLPLRLEPRPTGFRYPREGGDLVAATRRCVGVGACRREGGGVMCPSWMVTRDERHSTRGRARLLYEMLQGDVITGGWRSETVREALDLCLACKGCRSDCPVSVDMATYKAEFLHQHWRGRLRPASHYSMGWLPLWAAATERAPGAVNALTASPAAALLKRLGGIAPERDLPRFAPETLRAWFARRRRIPPQERPTLLLWPDTFTDHFDPAAGRAAVRVLEDAGFRVVLPRRRLCCGLTWISTGQLDVARRVLRRTLRELAPWLRRGVTVVGLEPSCTAVFRSDLEELLPDDEDAQRLRDQTLTLAETLARFAPGWSPGSLDRPVLHQVHCHQHAVLGDDADRELLRRAGARELPLEPSCCGLAGNFGFERGHHEVSTACAERALLPAVRSAPPDALLLADGFSCRTQIRQGTGREAIHLAQALALSIDGAAPAGDWASAVRGAGRQSEA